MIRSKALPEEVTQILEDNVDLLKTLDNLNKNDADSLNKTMQDRLAELKSKLDKSFNEAGKFWKGAVNQIWAFGPRRVGPNLLLNRVPNYNRQTIWKYLDGDSEGAGSLWDLDNSIVSGFQIATLSGPLCEEPLRGVCFIIEKWEMVSQEEKSKQSDDNTICTNSLDSQINGVNSDTTECSKCTQNTLINSDEVKNLTISDNEVKHKCNDDDDEVSSVKSDDSDSRHRKKTEAYGPFSGQLISCINFGCRKAFQTQPQRLVVAMYKCTIQATADVLGNTLQYMLYYTLLYHNSDASKHKVLLCNKLILCTANPHLGFM